MHRYNRNRTMAFTRPPEPEPFRSLMAFLLAVAGITLIGFGMNNPYAVKVVHTVHEQIITASSR